MKVEAYTREQYVAAARARATASDPVDTSDIPERQPVPRSEWPYIPKRLLEREAPTPVNMHKYLVDQLVEAYGEGEYEAVINRIVRRHLMDLRTQAHQLAFDEAVARFGPLSDQELRAAQTLHAAE